MYEPNLESVGARPRYDRVSPFDEIVRTALDCPLTPSGSRLAVDSPDPISRSFLSSASRIPRQRYQHRSHHQVDDENLVKRQSR